MTKTPKKEVPVDLFDFTKKQTSEIRDMKKVLFEMQARLESMEREGMYALSVADW